jgi:hypothetical protein
VEFDVPPVFDAFPPTMLESLALEVMPEDVAPPVFDALTTSLSEMGSNVPTTHPSGRVPARQTRNARL